MTPSISVVIPTFNRADYLREAIESVRQQTYADWELIIVDDGSSDHTADVLQSYASDARMQSVRQGQQERGAARNRGIHQARGGWIAFLDSDDVWLPHHLASCWRAHASAPGAGVIYAGSYIMNERQQLLGRASLRRPRGDHLQFMVTSFSSGGCNASSCMVQRQLFDEAGYFNEDTHLSGSEDWEMWARLASRTTFAVTENYTVKLRHHAQMSSRNTERMAQAMMRALGALYAHDDLIARLRPWRSQAYASVCALIAVNYYAAGEMATARGYVARAVQADPMCVLRNPMVAFTLLRSLLGARLSSAIRSAKWSMAARWHLRRATQQEKLP